jgi:hypothetical protein
LGVRRIGAAHPIRRQLPARLVILPAVGELDQGLGGLRLSARGETGQTDERQRQNQGLQTNISHKHRVLIVASYLLETGETVKLSSCIHAINDLDARLDRHLWDACKGARVVRFRK